VTEIRAETASPGGATSEQERTARLSVVAAVVLVALKLAAGLATGSLGLLAEAAHSGTDLVAALLTLFAVRVAVRPADSEHPFGHGKAEHLAALGEATFLILVSGFIAWQSVVRLVEGGGHEVEATWYAFAVLALVLVIDASRATVSWRASRALRSPALASNALHFASDFLGTTAVLAGLVLVRAGEPAGDSVAALIVAGLVILAASRLMRANVRVLMDEAPDAARRAATGALEEFAPDVDVQRLRLRQAAGKVFADVVISVKADEGVGQGHAAADRVESALHASLPDSDVVVHVEPRSGDASVRERATAAALSIPDVREVHNVTVLALEDGVEVSLHLKLPADTALEQAHAAAHRVEDAIRAAAEEVTRVETHIEPLGGTNHAVALEPHGAAREEATIRDIVCDVTGAPPRALMFRRAGDTIVAHVTLALDGSQSLSAAHGLASEIERRVHERAPSIGELVVHTEPR
jgi:cation diffusion facilitator family transporter